MRRFWIALLVLVPAVTGCRIEPTPQQYIDHLETPASEIAASRQELRTRLISVPAAVRRGNRGDVTTALMPVPDARVIGPDSAGRIDSTHDAVGALAALIGEGEWEVEEVAVEVGPRNNVAWFRTHYREQASDERRHFTGVFLRQEGEWRLVQGHLSREFSRSPPRAEADTAAGAG